MANEIDLATRSDAWQIAQNVLEWMRTQPREEVEHLAQPAFMIASALCDAYLATGYIDRWRSVGEAMREIAARHELPWEMAWADHEAGAAALAKGEWVEARTLLEEAATGFIALGEHQRVSATIGLLGAAISAVDDGDDDDGFGSEIGGGPGSPWRDAGGSAKDFGEAAPFDRDGKKKLADTKELAYT
jgi:hypothetical protein